MGNIRDTGIQLPDNRNQAVKRMHHLKRRFTKDPQFFEEYKRQMEELVSKFYAKKADVKPDNGKLWYLPHQAAKHQSKPGMVRIVFNCSTNYGGASLNRNLLSGPDLTNQLIGILMKFRTEEVAFMGDIETIFYQVKVPDNQRSFLRYLWWNNNDLNGDLVDYEIGLHVFGGTSSPGCCNYALRRAAIGNAPNCDTEVAETLLHNFYVDDLLKSVISKCVECGKLRGKICQQKMGNLIADRLSEEPPPHLLWD